MWSVKQGLWLKFRLVVRCVNCFFNLPVNVFLCLSNKLCVMSKCFVSLLGAFCLQYFLPRSRWWALYFSFKFRLELIEFACLILPTPTMQNGNRRWNFIWNVIPNIQTTHLKPWSLHFMKPSILIPSPTKLRPRCCPHQSFVWRRTFLPRFQRGKNAGLVFSGLGMGEIGKELGRV